MTTLTLNKKIREALDLMIGGTFSTCPVNDPWDMMGPAYKKQRQAVMTALLGRKATVAQSGVTAIQAELARQLGVDERKVKETVAAIRADMERGLA
jgi:hypothetical protein